MSRACAPDLGRLLAGLLRRKHDVVDVALLARERAVDRIGAGDVAGEPLIVGGRIDEQQIARVPSCGSISRSAGSSRSGRCRRSRDSPSSWRRCADRPPRSRLRLRTRNLPARAARMPARCASLEISTLLRRTSCSYGVLICRSSARIGVASCTVKPKNRSRSLRRELGDRPRRRRQIWTPGRAAPPAWRARR